MARGLRRLSYQVVNLCSSDRVDDAKHHLDNEDADEKGGHDGEANG
jgi:hypothetical protein